MTERINSQGQLSSLRSEHGTTTIQDALVSCVAGIAAQEVEKVQMGGGTSAAVGGFLQGVAGSVTGSSTKRSTPDLHQAVMEIRGIPFCAPCAREQEAYFAIGGGYPRDPAARLRVQSRAC